jgi:hypothetical protein
MAYRWMCEPCVRDWGQDRESSSPAGPCGSASVEASRTLEGHDDAVFAVAFALGGCRVVSRSLAR